ncbi:uncharacterized protein DUF4280 [Ureibacillus xyleni]|uniref:Uncharacterized protein DUF4280 n=1 Tax=Ureibacillus xyleni TaxID=614648 RepID=A0A285SSI7_9BACL|nr:PAAR-like protein [Ureibacillus xyleni]SOC09123.1 uncharacterized protein DUF4280 [Ureibacillus xyleni]
MDEIIVDGARLKCAGGPNALLKLQVVMSSVKVNGKKVATMNNSKVVATGICQIKTTAAQGVAQPCIPQLTQWFPASQSLVVDGSKPLLTSSCVTCVVGGRVTIQSSEFVKLK